MKRFLVIIAAFGILSASQANAGLLVEPLIGYNFSTKLDLEDETFSGSGVGYGGRLGYSNLGFQLGLDYLHSTIGIDDNSFDDDLEMSEWAAFVGFQFPVLFRVYAGYIFSATGDSKDDVLGKHEFSDGSGMKIGAGFTGLPFVAINLEYRSGSFGKYEVGGTEVTGSDPKYNSLFLSLSAPFTF